MLKRYAIWNKEDLIITPVGEVLSAEKWIERYPVAGVPTITVVCAAGEINGAFFGTLGQMVHMWESQGYDFSECTTDEAKLEMIEAIEDELNTPSTEPTTEERTAAALEFIAMSSLPDETTEV